MKMVAIEDLTPAGAVRLVESNVKSTEQIWVNWVTLGNWIEYRQAKAAEKAGGTRGPKYAPALAKALGQFHPLYKKFSDNGTLSFLRKCLDELDAVNAFRNRLDEDQRPSSPSGVWNAYQASLNGTIDFQSDEDELEEEENGGKGKGKKRKSFGEGHNREKELLERIALLEERLSEQSMSADPDLNAQTIWRRLVEVVGHDAAAALAAKTADKLQAIVRRVTAPIEDEDKATFEKLASLKLQAPAAPADDGKVVEQAMKSGLRALEADLNAMLFPKKKR